MHWWDKQINVAECNGLSCESIEFVAYNEAGLELYRSPSRSACVEALKHHDAMLNSREIGN